MISVALLVLGFAAADPYTASLVAVQSGDLLTVKQGQQEISLRLFGVDCPEPGQPQAEEAAEFSRKAAEAGALTITPVAEDQQGGLVAKVALPNGDLLHERLVEAGLGWWDRENVPQDSTLRRLNARALLGKVGIYADDAALAPWDYRRSHGGAEVRYTVAAEEKAPPPPAPAPIPTLKAKGTKIGAQAPTITPEMIRTAEALDPMTLMLRHAPSFVRDGSGKTLGLTASNISQIPLAKELGFQDGDVITSVNGIRLEQESQILGLAAQLQGTKHFEIDVLRGGAPTRIVINAP